MTPVVRSDESGVALLVVLLAITLLTITVVEFTYSTQVETRLARGARNALQAYYLARSGVNVAEALLTVDTLINESDSLRDIWAVPIPPMPLGDGTIMIRVLDENRFLNLNALAKPIVPVGAYERRTFEALFTILGIDKRLLSGVIDWLDGNAEPEPAPPGAEQPFYLGLTPPVAVPNGPVFGLRELLSVRDMTPEILSRLSNLVTVIPDLDEPPSFEVNVNTAPSEVLAAAYPALGAEPGALRQLLTVREEHALESNSDLKLAPRAHELITEAVDPGPVYDSTYFRIEAVGTVGGIARGITTVVRRDGDPLPSVTRLSWSPRVAQLALTTLPPSDFLDSLPPLGGG